MDPRGFANDPPRPTAAGNARALTPPILGAPDAADVDPTPFDAAQAAWAVGTNYAEPKSNIILGRRKLISAQDQGFGPSADTGVGALPLPLPPFQRGGRSRLTRRREHAATADDTAKRTAGRLTYEQIQERRISTIVLLNQNLDQSSPVIPHRQEPKSQRPRPKHHFNGYREGYKVGDALRCPSHMAFEPSPERAFYALKSLRKHDFAFVKRSNGSYSYAILAQRSMERPQRGNVMTSASSNEGEFEECLTFVINDVGSTKVISRRHWADHVRLVVPEAKEIVKKELLPTKVASKSKHEYVQEIPSFHTEGAKDKEFGYKPPIMVSFATKIAPEGDDSSISSGSEYEY